MKKLSLMLAALLTLSACGQVKAPEQTMAPSSEAVAAAPPSGDTKEAVSSSMEAETAKGSGNSVGEAPQDVSAKAAPMPSDMPEKTQGALELPSVLATRAEGWKVELLTPAQYEIEAPMFKGGARGFLDVDIFKAVRDGKMTLFNRNGKQISEDGEYDEDDIRGWIAPDGRAVTIQKDEQAGLVDAADGAVLVPFQYKDAWATRDYYEVEDENKSTQLLRKDDLSIAYTLERGDRFEQMGQDRMLLYQNSTLKIFDKAGTPIKNLVCDDVNVVAVDTDPVGVNRLTVKEGEKWALYDGDGEMLTNAVYEDFNPRFLGDYITFQKAGKWGVMDYTGKITIKPRWDDIILYENSASLCKDNKWTGTTELDREPEVTQPIYDDVGPFSETGYAWFEKDGKYGLLDDDGNVMMTPRQSGRVLSGIAGFDEDVFLVEGDNGPNSYGVLTGGKLVIPTDSIIFSQGINPYHAEDEAYNLVYTPSGKWGYIDGQGQYVIDSRFEEADGFIKGRDVAMVKLDGKICLIDRKGNVVLETVFEDCGALNPETMVCAMRYRDAAGNTADCLVRLHLSES